MAGSLTELLLDHAGVSIHTQQVVNHIVQLVFFYSGYCMCTSPHTTPLSVYLGFVPGDPLNKVEVWILSYAWHGVPLIDVMQTAGFFLQSTNTRTANMPLTGNTKLDMYTIPLVLFDHNINNTNPNLNL